MEERAKSSHKELDVLNLPSRKERHRSKKVKKERTINLNPLRTSNFILKTLLFLFMILIISIPFAYIYWLQ